MSDPSQTQALAELIESDLKVELNFSLEEQKGADWLLGELQRVIGYLLDHDFQRLLNALYRIDVSEQKIKKILATADPDQLSIAIAHEVLIREKQKLFYRQKYRSDR
jgi:hypothetical protein